MSDLDQIEERRRPKRRLFTFWRLFAVAALGVTVWAVSVLSAPEHPPGPFLAVHEVTGIITVDPERDGLIRSLARNPEVAAMVLRVDSPGGTTTGAEALFEALREVAVEKPVVALMGEVAASGGYLAAIAADHVIARGNSLTGSIGVVSQRPNISGLLEMVGVRVTEQRSSEFKANPSLVSDGTPATRAWDEEVIRDAYAWFRGLVGERRALDVVALERVADGRVFTGRQALERGLVDEIGGPPEARAWLASQGVDPSLPTRLIEVEDDRPLWMELLDARLGTEGAAALSAPLTAFSSGGGPRLFSLAE